MSRTKSVNLPLALVGVIFFIVGIMFSSNFFDSIKFSKISSTGKQYSAVIDEIDYTDASYNDYHYGRAKVYYTDDKGEEKEGYTSYYFREDKAPQIGSAIYIREFNGDICEDNFTPSNVYTLSSIFFFVFGGIGLTFTIACLINFFKYLKDRRVLNNGRIVTATFISSNKALEVGDKSLYSITLSYRGDYNQEVIYTTPARYHVDEAYKFELMKNFSICYLGDKVVITEDISKVDILNIKHIANDERTYCTKCGTENRYKNLNCPNCGHNEFTCAHNKK